MYWLSAVIRFITHVRVHGPDLFPGGSTENLDDLHQLIDTRLSREERLAKHQLGHHTTRRPNIDVGSVVCSAKDELRGTVVARADVADVWFTGNEDLGRSKVAELQNACVGIEEQVLWLDVTMADTDGVDVCQRPEELVHVQLDLEHWHDLLELCVVAQRAVDGLWDVFKDEVEVDFVFLAELVSSSRLPTLSPLE